MTVELVFWLCVGLLAYTYVGYPLCVAVMALVLRRDVRCLDIFPTVTVVIAAYNEGREIRRTVLNKLSQDYPAELLDVIVVSDGSDDGTDDIVKGISPDTVGRITLLRQEPRQGKTQALNQAIGYARGDVVIFSDANSIYATDAVRRLVGCFADPTVGYVTGRMVYENPDHSGIADGSGKYMSYENTLRMLETRIGSIVGVDGGIDAIRRNLYVPMRADQLPDFVLPLAVVEQGKRVVYEKSASVFESALSSSIDEFRMRVRVALRALWAIYDKRRLLNPFRYPLFAWQLFSHKLLRYLAFIPLSGLLVASGLVCTVHWFYGMAFTCQLAAYFLGALGHFMKETAARSSKLMVPYYFLILNAACVIACGKFLRRQKMVIWKPRIGA